MLLLSACGAMIWLKPESAIPHPLQIITHRDVFYLPPFNYALFVPDYKGANRLKNPQKELHYPCSVSDKYLEMDLCKKGKS